MKRTLDRDLSPRDKRSRSDYSDREPVMREQNYNDRRDRDDARGFRRDDPRDRDEMRGRPSYRERESYESDRRTPVKRYRDDPYNDRPPPFDDRALSPPPRYRDDRGPPPRDDRGPPRDDRGPPPRDLRGPPRDDRGPPRDDRGPPPRDRGPPPRDYPPREYHPEPRDYRQRSPPPRGPPPGYQPPPPITTNTEFRSLCISNINPRVHDHALRDVLYDEFKGFGEGYNVRVVHTVTARIAYVNFRTPDEAEIALQARKKLVLFNEPVKVDAVIKKRDQRRTPPPDLRHGTPYSEFPPTGPPRPPVNHRPIIKRNNEYEERPGHGGPGHGGPGHGGPGPGPGPGPGHGGPPPLGHGPPPPGPPPPHFRGPPPPFEPEGGPPPPHGQSPMQTKPKAPPKFPHHLHHVTPEDDPHSTRNLFIGNLDMTITEFEIREAFGQYGIIEDIDIKKPTRGVGNAYAFLKYKNLDMAHQAKVSLSGSKVGKLNCKIGYGQIQPSRCLWVGGLGPWIKPEDLEKEFDRFGVIMSTFWPGGKNYAFILYDDVEACKSAHDGMRGAPLGGPERRIRTDYVDPEEIPSRGPDGAPPPGQTGQPPPPGFDTWQDIEPPFNKGRERPARSPFRDDYPPGEEPPGFHPPGPSSNSNGDTWRRRSRTPEPAFKKEFPRERGDGRISPPFRPGRPNDRRPDVGRRNPELERIKCATEMSKFLPKAWKGGMVLKSSAFPTEMHLVEGDRSLAETLMNDPGSKGGGTLKITQRLRLLQPKLDDLSEKIESAKVRGQYCILLAVNAPGHVVDNPTNSLQIRPLRNLVTYLEQKDSAGVISLPPSGTKNKDGQGVLHAFPPCDFSRSLLTRQAPNIITDAAKDEYLLVVVLRGSA